MMLRDLLAVIADVAKQSGIREPYIVGGIPRDISLGLMEGLNDIDLTNGDSSISDLADLVAQKLGVTVSELSDGHKKIRFERFSVDFSTNFRYENVDQLLGDRGITVITNMVRETFSRDFTINTLMVPLDFSKILDLTAMGKYDLSHKNIRCPLDPVVAITASPNRIIRAFYYSAKYGMSIDQSLKSAIKDNNELMNKVKPKYASDKISAAIKYDANVIDDLIETGVLQKVKLTKDITDQLIKSKRLSEIL